MLEDIVWLYSFCEKFQTDRISFIIRRFLDMTCKIRNGGCEHICQPFGPSQYHCACHPGYKLDDDAHNCTGTLRYSLSAFNDCSNVSNFQKVLSH